MKKPLLTIVFATGLFTTMAQIQGYTVGQTVANFTVTDINGNSHTLYNYTAQGKYVMLDFFFVTCPPCQQTTPYFNQLYDTYGCNGGDLVCLSINTGQDNNTAVQGFESTYGGSFSHCPSISGDGGSATVDNDFNPAAYPTYCLIGPDNKLLNADIWPISSMSDFVAAFPMSSNITPMACSATGITQPEITTQIKVYPNPANAQATVVLEGITSQENISITVTDIAGRVLEVPVTRATNNFVYTLDVAALPAGSYAVCIKNSNAILTTSRFMVAK